LDAEVSLSFVSPIQIRDLNNDHRGVDSVTDVLSFPQSEDGGVSFVPGGPALLGDIVICSRRAREQAGEYGHGERREFIYLFVHGLLHLLGHDHATDEDRAVMRAAEERAIRGVRF
jgi:probable rRNA maturation factor